MSVDRIFYQSKLSIIMKQYAKIEKAELYALKIPFKMDFAHAMESRSFSDSLILKIEGQGKRDSVRPSCETICQAR